MVEGDKEGVVFDCHECDRFLPLGAKQGDILFVALLLLEMFELGKVAKLRQNKRRFFHRVIIASVCCGLMGGCGHKTNPVYVPKKELSVKG